MHRFLRGARVHVLQTVHERIGLLRAHQIGFADENLVSKAHLTARFLAVIELLGGVFGIHQGQDGIEQKALGNLVVHEKSLRHGARIGQAGGFDHHALKVQQAFALFGGQQLQGRAQVFADGAADAAIAHLNDLLVGVAHQNVVVDVFFAKLVLNDRDFLPVRFLQHALEQGGFARPQKTGEDGGRNQRHGQNFLGVDHGDAQAHR